MSKMKAHASHPANKQKWVKPDHTLHMPIPHSGGEGKALKGYDARQRTIAGPNGVNRTPDIIASPGPHVPTKKESMATPFTHFKTISKSGSKAWSA